MLGRVAGAALGLGKSLFKGMGPTEIALRLGPDAMYGIMEGAMTPGEGDKIIAGSGSAIGGAMGSPVLGARWQRSAWNKLTWWLYRGDRTCSIRPSIERQRQTG